MGDNFYYASYAWRRKGELDQSFDAIVLKNQHPVDWALESGHYVTILWWKEITEAEYENWKDKVE